MKRSIFITLGLLLLHLLSQAQSSVGIDSINYSAPAGGTFNSQGTFIVNVVNYGPQPLSGEPLDIKYAVDTTGSGTVAASSDTSNSHISFFTLAVGAEQADTALVTFTNGAFRSGINTVVIWPRSNGNALITTRDSLKINIMILASGIENYNRPQPLVFPNPSSQTIFIIPQDPEYSIERVRILNPEGRLLSTEKFNGRVDVNTLAPGAYYLELIRSEGASLRFKIIKE